MGPFFYEGRNAKPVGISSLTPNRVAEPTLVATPVDVFRVKRASLVDPTIYKTPLGPGNVPL